MNKEEVFEKIQEYTSDIPLLLIGIGASIPVGIPGMAELANYLLDNLKLKYAHDDIWNEIADKLQNKIDLETALTSHNLSGDLLNDIRKLT